MSTHLFHLFISCLSILLIKNDVIRIRMMMMFEKRQKRNSLKDMHLQLRVRRLRSSRKATLMKKPKILNWVNILNYYHNLILC
jgi:hypothetical protein